MKTLISALVALALLPVAALGAQGHHYGWTQNRGHHYGWYKHHHYARHYSTSTTYTTYSSMRRRHYGRNYMYGYPNEEWQYATPRPHIYHRYGMRTRRVTHYYMTRTPVPPYRPDHEEWQFGGGH